MLYGGTEILKSQHAGYTDDEILVPLIIINTEGNNQYIFICKLRAK